MINELFVADLEVRLRSSEAAFLLRMFKTARASGQAATIAMLDRDIMRAYGAHLAVVEQSNNGEFAFLYTGAQVPDDNGAPLSGKTTQQIHQRSADLYRLGCSEAAQANDAVGINHRTDQGNRVHRWECLFLPMEDSDHHRMFVVLAIPREYKDEFQRLLLDGSPDAIIAAYPVRDSHNEIVDAIIVDANRRAAEFFDRESSEALQETSLLRVFGDVEGSGSWDRHLTTLRSKKAQIFEYHHRGEKISRWFRVSSSPIRDGMLVTMTDITDMKRHLLELEHQKKLLMDEMEQRRGLEQELWALAHLDPLTGLANRRAFRDQAMLKLAESQTAHRPCAVITFDIDHFKRVNDAYGHGAGDTVLRRVADIIKAPLRPNTDFAARMGGEEFAVILPDTDMDSAIAFAEKLRRRIEQTIVIVGEHEIRPTVSAGIAMNRKTINLDELLERADRALYAAKRAGRNKVVTEVDVQEGSSRPSSTAAA